MKKFLKFCEALALDDVETKPGSKPVTVLMGRFQPPTIGHNKLISAAVGKRLPVILAVIKGAKTSEKRSPFPFQMQKKLMEAILPPGSLVLGMESGFIGDILTILRRKGMEPKFLIVGTDRVASYAGQISRYKEKFNLDIKIVEVKRGDEDVSATKVREALKSDDENLFKSMTDKSIHKFYKELKRHV